MKKYFIFDMDGVLVDSEPIHYQVMSIVFDRLQLSLSEKYRHTLTGMAGIPMWSKIVKDCHLPKSPSEYLDFHRDIFFEELPNKNIPEVKGVKDLLFCLKENDYKLALASSSTMKLIDIFTEQLQIKSYFDTIVSGENLQRSKPFPDIFLKVAENFNTAPESCIVLEDSTNGVLAAKSAGMTCIGFANPNSGKQDLSKADVIVKSMDEITSEMLRTI
ncbi:HAD family hydrolase [Capnocytophaga catalasegens]|uniref:Phosphatase n=1 Tax=Capnocytophaga catalasegens TaxID=1004260 RepID=A0AAV5AZH4_9FLAO|nr:HAD family hydrolase [Capnocytophaga catalasegens]GIZ16444.1 phosphatase [Capnocytophaga catalasegens]GJM50317.1 phosphatase [Capnocytophaga catalasegens]GJM53834.1 phosphatase [Capnocytophaga catalasegens]